MKPLKKYYKLVRTAYDDSLKSYAGGDLEYKLNEWTIAPDDTRLFVFDNLETAKEHAFPYSYELYECEIVGGIKGFGAYYYSDNSSFWKLFNKKVKSKKKIIFTKQEFDNIPLADMSAVLCKKVKLTKKVA